MLILLIQKIIFHNQNLTNMAAGANKLATLISTSITIGVGDLATVLVMVGDTLISVGVGIIHTIGTIHTIIGDGIIQDMHTETCLEALSIVQVEPFTVRQPIHYANPED